MAKHKYQVHIEGVVNGERYTRLAGKVEAETPEEAKARIEKVLSKDERVIFIDANYEGFEKIYYKGKNIVEDIKEPVTAVTLTVPEEPDMVVGKLNLENEDWFKALVDEAGSTITEAMFQSNWIIIEGYHTLGKLIEDNRKKFMEAGVNNPVPVLARHIKKSERTVYRAVQFYNAYPELEKLPEGKDTSWHRIVNKYLPGAKNGDEREDIFRLQFTQSELDIICESLSQYAVTNTGDWADKAKIIYDNLKKRKGGT